MSYVNLPVYPVMRAAQATLAKLTALVSKNEAELRARYSKPFRIFWVGPKTSLSKPRIDKLIKLPACQKTIFTDDNGNLFAERYRRAYSLLQLAAAVNLGNDALITVSGEDLRAIGEVYFDVDFNRALRPTPFDLARAEIKI